jgi:DNA polymerase
MAGGGRGRDAQALVAAVAGCDRCPLASSGRPSLTEPPRRADVLILGEAPGRSEAEAGRPFVGRSGQVLDRALAEAGLPRERAFVTNVVLHRPIDAGRRDRHPTTSEILACGPWLDAQLAILRPKVVLALGQVATGRLLGRSTRLEEVRGRAHRCGDRWVVPTYHPASLNRAPDRRQAFHAAVRLVVDLLARGQQQGK